MLTQRLAVRTCSPMTSRRTPARSSHVAHFREGEKITSVRPWVDSSIANLIGLIEQYSDQESNGVNTLFNNRTEIDTILRELQMRGPKSGQESVPLAGSSWKLVYTTVQTTSGGKFGPWQLGPLTVGPFFGSVQQIFNEDGKTYANVCSFSPLLKIYVEGQYEPSGMNEITVRFTSINLKLAGITLLSKPFEEKQGKGGKWNLVLTDTDMGLRVLYSDNNNVFVLVKE